MPLLTSLRAVSREACPKEAGSGRLHLTPFRSLLIFLAIALFVTLSCTQAGLGGGFDGWGGPAISGDSIYQPSKKGSDRASLRVFSAFNGTDEGRFTAGGEPIAIYGTPLIVDIPGGGTMIYTTMVYSGDGGDFGRIFAVRKGDTAESAWEFPAQGQDTVDPIFGGVAYSRDTNTVYFGSEDGNLYALDALDGSPKIGTGGAFFPAKSPIWSTPTVDNGIVYFGTMGGTLFGVREEGGKVMEFKAGGAIAANPVVKDGVVYVGSFNKNFYAIDPSGRVRWSFPTGNWIWAEALLAQDPRAGDIIFVGSLDGVIYALEANSGTPRWASPVGQGIRGKPVLASRSLTSGRTSSLIDQVLVVGSRNGMVFGFDANTGTAAWEQPFAAGERVLAPLAARNNVVFVSNTDYDLFAIDASTGQSIPNWVTGQ